MARQEIATCDLCESPAPHSFTISHGGKVVITDLCENHSEPFLEAFSRGSATPRKAPSERQVERPQTHRVVPID